jgi:hypothetical protein
MSKEDLTLLKDEIFQKMRELEKKMNKESNEQKDEISLYYKRMDEKVDHILTNNREIIESVVSEKINYEKIHSLENFKNKADGILISHEIRINNHNKDINDMKTKYDKVIVDNLSVPGFIGNSCQYKNIAEYIVSTISEFSRFKYEKDTLKIETKELRNKIDNIFKSLSLLLGLSEDMILVDKFKDIDSFFEFLLENNKEMKSVNIDELILQKFEVQYYPGFMKSWKDCFLYYTPQKHLILCDNKDIISLENIVQIFDMNKINFKLNSSFKKPFLFEISPNYGIILKRYNTYIFDALNGENLFKICLIFKDYIIKKGNKEA